MLDQPVDKQQSARKSRTSGIDRSLQIFDTLREKEDAMTGYELAKAIGAPISTVYTLLDELSARDLLSRHPDGRVWLGSRLHHYGLAYARKLDLLTVASREMSALALATNECVQICGRDDGMMIVLGMIEGPGHFKVMSRVGTRVPLNWTASGRLLVGHMPKDECVAFFRRSAKPSPTGRAVTDPKVLAKAASDAYARRAAVQYGESDFSVACIASPIRNAQGECVATLSVVVSEAKARQMSKSLIEQVQQSTLKIEMDLGIRH